MGKSRTKLAFVGVVLFLSMATSARANILMLMEYQWRNATGYHWSPAVFWSQSYETLKYTIGISPRFQTSALDSLSYQGHVKWMPWPYVGLASGISHKDFYDIDVGEDLAWFGGAILIPIDDKSWVGIEGGIYFRAGSYTNFYALPFSFSGDMNEYFYYQQVELILGYDGWTYRLSIGTKDPYGIYRFNSIGLDQTLFIHSDGMSYLIGFEVRPSGSTIGATSFNNWRSYIGINF